MSDTMVDWRPIATAPESSGPMLVWDNDQGQCVIANRYERPGGGVWWMVADSYGYNEDGEIPARDITHWAALPDGPQPWDND